MEGKHEESKIIEILEALIKKGETKDELAGGIFILRDKATKVSACFRTTSGSKSGPKETVLRIWSKMLYGVTADKSH